MSDKRQSVMIWGAAEAANVPGYKALSATATSDNFLRPRNAQGDLEIQLQWTNDASITGVFSIEGTNAQYPVSGDWCALSTNDYVLSGSALNPTNAAGNALLRVLTPCLWVRLKWTSTSGSGTVRALARVDQAE